MGILKKHHLMENYKTITVVSSNTRRGVMLQNTLRVRLHGLLNKTLKAVIQTQEDPRDPRGLFISLSIISVIPFFHQNAIKVEFLPSTFDSLPQKLLRLVTTHFFLTLKVRDIDCNYNPT